MGNIRIMETRDLEAINEIYNQAVESGFSTAHTEPVSLEERRVWSGEHPRDQFPVYVWEENGQIIAWISFGPYRKGRQALQSTAEISYFVHAAHRRRGIGSRLLEYAINKAPGLGFRTLIAILLEPNTTSIDLLRKFGFEKWGDMPGIAEIDGRQYNHQYYGLHIRN